MRPKLLEIEGLHSFKEAQTIDFTYLGETGLFGIFGPTGSGKSTVLDAITFALYGKVKRAERGTQGIINTDRDTARVSFTFELLRNGERKTYRVERVYQRKKNAAVLGSCEPKVVRLIEVTAEGDLPLYDKASEVSNQVEALLGLNHEDFTKAVVLPQNSFQEFLLLDNTKKRAMLERVFYLEEYGKGLLDKINRRMVKLKSKKDRLEGQMAAFDDATKEAVEKAKKEMAQAEEERIFWQKELGRAEKEYKSKAEKWQLTQALLNTEAKLEELLARKEAMESNRQRLELAKKAEKLEVQINQAAWYEQELAKVQKEKQEIELMLPRALQELEEIRKNLLSLREESTRQQPILVEKKTRLNEGLTYVAEINQLEQELQQIRAKWLGKNEEIKACRQKITEKEETIRRDTEKLAEMEERLKKLRVTPAARQWLQQGMQLEQGWEKLQGQLQEEEAAAKELAAKAIALQSARQAAEEALNEAGEKQRHFKEMLARLEEEQKADAAYLLALTLEENKPCPVCGSCHHPHPAPPPEPETELRLELKSGLKPGLMPGLNQELRLDRAEAVSKEAVAAAKEKLDEAAAVFKEREKEYVKLQTEWEYFTARQKEQAAKLEQLQAAAAQAQQDLADFVAARTQEVAISLADAFEAFPQVFVQTGEVRFALLWQELARKDDLAWQLEAEQNRLQKDLNCLRREEQQLKEELQPLEEAITVINTQGTALRKQKDELEGKLRKLTGELKAESAEDIKREIARIEEKLAEYVRLDQSFQEKQNALQQRYDGLVSRQRDCQNRISLYEEQWQKESARLKEALAEEGFADVEAVRQVFLSKEKQAALGEELQKYDQELNKLYLERKLTADKLAGEIVSQEEWQQVEAAYNEALVKRDESLAKSEKARMHLSLLKERHKKRQEVEAACREVARAYDYHDQIQRLLKGDRNKDNSFIDYIAEERLRYIALKASEILGEMTQYKYGLELDAQMGFIIRDHGNGGILRAVTTLSGGEIFLTSLSLALALSEQIQLKGQSPLEFFFLDEGFGTLDGELLDTVIDALEGLSSQSRMIGLISHVPELRSRMSRRLIVEPPTMQGEGSRVFVEKA